MLQILECLGLSFTFVELLNGKRIGFKPFNCIVCMAFWIGVVMNYNNPLKAFAVVPIAFIFDHWFNNRKFNLKI